MTYEEAIPIRDALMILNTELDIRRQGYYDHLQYGGEGDCAEEANLNALAMAIEALEKVKKSEETFEWCTDCKEYDQEKHCCHRWTKCIRQTVTELKADGVMKNDFHVNY